MAGQTSLLFAAYPSIVVQVASKKLNAIAVTSAKRIEFAPDLPTVAETLPGFFAGGWNVLLAPIGTPQDVIDKTSVDLRKALDDAEVKKKLAQLGGYLHPMTPAEVTAFAQEQQRTWRPIAEKVAKEMAEPK
jgi:tripartite-type tricarboxylate transporter receptor subunit TctC